LTGWAKLLKRVFEIDMEHCLSCGGALKIIAAILEQPVIEKILTHLGLQARAPPQAPVRDQALQSGLSAVNRRRFSDLAPRVAGIGCI